MCHTQGWTLPPAPVQLHPMLPDPPLPPDIRNDVTETPAPFRAFRHPLNISFYLALQCRTPVTRFVGFFLSPDAPDSVRGTLHLAVYRQKWHQPVTSLVLNAGACLPPPPPPCCSTVAEDHVKLELMDELAILAWATRRAQDLEASSHTPFQVSLFLSCLRCNQRTRCPPL